MNGGDGDDSGRVKIQGSGGTFVTISKNVRSIQTEERFEEFLQESKQVRWHAILVNETWRKEKEEVMRLESGDLWLGSGGTEGKHGVGVLLSKDLSLQRFVAISPRLSYVEADGYSQKFAIIAAYMPHG